MESCLDHHSSLRWHKLDHHLNWMLLMDCGRLDLCCSKFIWPTWLECWVKGLCPAAKPNQTQNVQSWLPCFCMFSRRENCTSCFYPILYYCSPSLNHINSRKNKHDLIQLAVILEPHYCASRCVAPVAQNNSMAYSWTWFEAHSSSRAMLK